MSCVHMELLEHFGAMVYYCSLMNKRCDAGIIKCEFEEKYNPFGDVE